MKWDDLKILVAVGRIGSFSGAAKELGVNHSSVSRRMRQLETQSGKRLFERLPNGLLLTPAGDAMYQSATRMADEANKLERNVLGRDAQLSGVIRFATVDATARNIMPSLKKFLDLHPNIELELIVGQHLENLGRREADVVLRATNNPPETYVGRCVAKHAFPIYAARDVVAQFGPDSPLDAYPWIAWEDGFTQHWMQKNVPNARIVFRANTAFGVGEALRTGIGIAHYACFGADLDPTLVRLRPPETDLDLDIWLLTHSDQRHIPRIQTFMAFMTEEIQVQRDLIEGRLGG